MLFQECVQFFRFVGNLQHILDQFDLSRGLHGFADHDHDALQFLDAVQISVLARFFDLLFDHLQEEFIDVLEILFSFFFDLINSNDLLDEVTHSIQFFLHAFIDLRSEVQ